MHFSNMIRVNDEINLRLTMWLAKNIILNVSKSCGLEMIRKSS